jgi:ribosome recycling factor
VQIDFPVLKAALFTLAQSERSKMLAGRFIRRSAVSFAIEPLVVASSNALLSSVAAPRNAVFVHVSACLFAKPSKGADKGSGKATASSEPSIDASGPDVGGLDDIDPANLKVQMSKSIDYAKREFGKLRGGSATPQMLDHVMAEAYGEKQPLSGLAQISLKNPQLFVVSPFDAALATAISNAIRDAGLNLNPSVEGQGVKVPVPKPSKETRDTNLKLVAKIGEAAKAAIRRVRQGALDKLKKMEGVSSDEVFRLMKDVTAVTTAATEEVTKLAEKKKQEIEAA